MTDNDMVVPQDVSDYILYTSDSTGLIYYTPNLFNRCIYYQSNVHILISDLLRTIDFQKRNSLMRNLYPLFQKELTFIQNYPIRYFTIHGKVISFRMRLIQNQDFIIFKLDDNSNYKIHSIQFKCPISLLSDYSNEALSKFEQHCYLTCTVEKAWYLTKDMVEFNVIKIINIYDLNMFETTKFWTKCIQTRNILMKIPWNPQELQRNELYLLKDGQKKTPEVHIEIPRQNISTNYNAPMVESNSNEDFANEESIVIVNDVSDNSLSIDDETFELIDDTIIHLERKIYNELIASLLKQVSYGSQLNVNIETFFHKNDVQLLLEKCMEKHCINLVDDDEGHVILPSKKRYMNTFLTRLTNESLISWPEGRINIINIDLLQKLYNYSSRRLKAMITIKCLTITIDINFIVQKLELEKFTSATNTIIMIFKIALTHIVNDINSHINDWWIEKRTDMFWLIHLKYNTQSHDS
ncbi:similar to Saccharomyces cerevisiae YDR082W STN1 Telomere end-binding and capping protein [Maudiozyma barnettii]|uniref:Similar to Saccharomyces cerevisiae YDR082W STN1 Telomere end-binding and capping protein n=1 Tax=Maudiozyma barnettii TaxID=61262 RepID=A0A8H2VI89_9SACH|nr:uncharacterized protein KABA2_07S03256 [Kazachstania barnettii]CAB4255734.1 similar to Saccharomyces cerevisiae YDR082W STN1 Telomere end-binding and capping protein [Kazachstania barnettii]CAD1784295.1 similar to Saccharomyces cerevisiae YDR082W STN1 Telomere end-binding and capping protein [Kazachstania barnettii]